MCIVVIQVLVNIVFQCLHYQSFYFLTPGTRSSALVEVQGAEPPPPPRLKKIIKNFFIKLTKIFKKLF